MICENCNKEHDGSYGSGRFCSCKCARGFSTKTKRKEINEKVSKSLKGKSHTIAQQKARKEYLKSDKFKFYVQRKKEKHIQKLLDANWNDLNPGQKRERVFYEQNLSCNRCKLSKWQNEPIVLEIEHKDGNHQNNSRDNLEGLCPNCHSLTDTWRGRNKNGQNSPKQYKRKEEYLKAYLESNGNFRQALLSMGLAAKGANYGQMKKILTEFGIDWRKTIKSNL